MHYKLALLGFGNVGRATAELLLRKEAELKETYGFTFSVTAIATGSRGRRRRTVLIHNHNAPDAPTSGAGRMSQAHNPT